MTDVLEENPVCLNVSPGIGGNTEVTFWMSLKKTSQCFHLFPMSLKKTLSVLDVLEENPVCSHISPGIGGNTEVTFWMSLKKLLVQTDLPVTAQFPQ